MGTSRDQSSEFQKFAEAPEDVFRPPPNFSHCTWVRRLVESSYPNFWLLIMPGNDSENKGPPFADFSQSGISLVPRLMQLNYASGLIGLLAALLWIPSLWIFHPIFIRPDIPPELQIIVPCLLAVAITCWYFWKADLIKLHRWKTEKILILVTAFMFTGNLGTLLSLLAHPELPPGAASQLFPLLVFTMIFYSLGTLFALRLSRWWQFVLAKRG